MSVESLIQRFRNNECTPEEIELLQQWIAQLDIADDAAELSPAQLDAVRNRMYRQLTHQPPVMPNRHRLPYRRLLVAASWLVLALSVTIVWYFNRPLTVSHQLAQSLPTVIENNHPGIRRITLPDGSQVCLNMHSRLEFDPQQFNRKERLVKLSGEGFFEVVSLPLNASTGGGKKPFIVETGSLRTRVLGTAFNIEAYAQESEVRVSLVHGKIALDDTATDQTTVLSPNQAVRYSKQTQSWQVLPVEAANVALWTKGYLVFNEVPLQEALERISKRYQITIEYDQALLQNKRITASFHNSNLPTVLTNILFVHDLLYKNAGGKLVIVKKV